MILKTNVGQLVIGTLIIIVAAVTVVKNIINPPSTEIADFFESKYPPRKYIIMQSEIPHG
jgi:hypothetical protein